jgi:hypothetical protein
LEGLGVHLFSHIDGDYFTILGLPLLPLLAFLRQHGVVDGWVVVVASAVGLDYRLKGVVGVGIWP